MAILLIVLLSVGFFSGLKITRKAMWNTCANYLDEQNFYDYRIFSTDGFREEDLSVFEDLSYVEDAEAVTSVNALVDTGDSTDAFVLMEMPQRINLPSLTAGRMPETRTECVADSRFFSEEDIGKTITVTDDNEDTVTDSLKETSFKIVGLVNSPLYLSNDRGTADIGSGSLAGFFCLPSEAFDTDYASEIDVTLTADARKGAGIYSEAYDDAIDSLRDEIEAAAESAAESTYDSILSEISINRGFAESLAETMGISEPSTYVLTRSDNAGYMSFQNDTSIVSAIANIFPLFFILIALLVCMTTMTRMVEEERGQIGTLKSLGYSDFSITMKYLLYAGSATLVGWAVGYFGGIYFLPRLLWWAYSTIYSFAPITYIIDGRLALLTLTFAMAAILGCTWFSCRSELTEMPAILIRPKAAKSGQRILIEKIRPFWRRLPFLRKVTLRNMFRYKKRMILMLIGISCCTALVVTAFGVQDSMTNLDSLQYDDIQKWDMTVSFDEGHEDSAVKKLEEESSISGYLVCAEIQADVRGSGEDSPSMNSVNLMSFADGTDLSDYWNLTDLYDRSRELTLPGDGEALISKRLAEKLGVEPGDTIVVEKSTRESGAEKETWTLKVSGVFVNYVSNYVIVSDETYAGSGEDNFEEDLSNTLLILYKNELTDSEEQSLSERLTAQSYVTAVSCASADRNQVASSLDCVDYIIWVVVIFSGALAFVVIYNLTNINIAERCREIATVEVLGFYDRETRQYVLWENLATAFLAGILGLPLGRLFHYAVMSMILIDNTTFPIVIRGFHYLMALALTILFAVIVNLAMRRSIRKISMAEALKAVE